MKTETLIGDRLFHIEAELAEEEKACEKALAAFKEMTTTAEVIDIINHGHGYILNIEQHYARVKELNAQIELVKDLQEEWTFELTPNESAMQQL